MVSAQIRPGTVCTKNPSQRKAMLSWKKSIHLDFGSSNSNESGPYPHDVATSCDFKLSLGENLSFWPRAHTSTWILGERQRIAWCATQGKRMWEVCRFVSSRAWGFIVIFISIPYMDTYGVMCGKMWKETVGYSKFDTMCHMVWV